MSNFFAKSVFKRLTNSLAPGLTTISWEHHICKTTLPHQKCWLTKCNNLALKQPCLLRYPESSSQARGGNCISRKFSESVVGVLRDHLLSWLCETGECTENQKEISVSSTWSGNAADRGSLLFECFLYNVFSIKKIPIIISVYLTPYLLHIGLICRGSFTFCWIKTKLSRNYMPANEAFQALHHTIARLPSQGIQLHILCEVTS